MHHLKNNQPTFHPPTSPTAFVAKVLTSELHIHLPVTKIHTTQKFTNLLELRKNELPISEQNFLNLTVYERERA